MRVNVCYSVELEEVPEVVNGLLGEISNKLRDLADQLDDQGPLLMDGDTLAHAQQIANSIDDSRRKLSDLDRRLADAMSVYAGYYQTVTNPEPTAPVEIEQIQEMSESVNETAERLEEVATMIADTHPDPDAEITPAQVQATAQTAAARAKEEGSV